MFSRKCKYSSIWHCLKWRWGFQVSSVSRSVFAVKISFFFISVAFFSFYSTQFGVFGDNNGVTGLNDSYPRVILLELVCVSFRDLSIQYEK